MIGTATAARTRRTYSIKPDRGLRWADQDTWVYKMVGCDDTVVVAINRADWDREVTIPEGAWVDLVGGGDVNPGAYNLHPRSFLVLGVR